MPGRDKWWWFNSRSIIHYYIATLYESIIFLIAAIFREQILCLYLPTYLYLCTYQEPIKNTLGYLLFMMTNRCFGYNRCINRRKSANPERVHQKTDSIFIAISTEDKWNMRSIINRTKLNYCKQTFNNVVKVRADPWGIDLFGPCILYAVRAKAALFFCRKRGVVVCIVKKSNEKITKQRRAVSRE